MKVAVFTQIYNEPLSNIRRYLTSISFQTFKDFDLYVIDDGSTLPTYTYFEEVQKTITKPKIHVVKLEHKGYFRGWYLLRDKYDIVGKIDGDVFFNPSAIEEVLKRFDSKVGIVYGNIVNEESSFGAFMFVRSEILRKIKPYYVLLTYGDSYLYHKTRELGYKIVRCEEAKVFHLRKIKMTIKRKVKEGFAMYSLGYYLPFVKDPIKLVGYLAALLKGFKLDEDLANFLKRLQVNSLRKRMYKFVGFS